MVMRSSSDQLKTLLIAHRRRLDQLEIKKASLGLDTPPETITEIEDIEKEIVKTAASLKALDTVETLSGESDSEFVDRRSIEPRLHIMVATIESTVAEFLSLRVFVTNEINRLFRLGLIWGTAVVLVVIGFMVAIATIVWLRG